MDSDYVIKLLEQCKKENRGDYGRNEYLQKILKDNKTLLHSDKKYLEKLLGKKLYELRKPEKRVRPTIKQDILNPNLAKCTVCQIPLELNETTIRKKTNWYHPKCYEQLDAEIISTNPPPKPQKEIPKRPDAVQVTIVGLIFAIMVSSVYFLLGTLSMIAMGLGGVMLVYHLFSAHSKLFSKHKPGRKGPSAMVIFLLVTPFIMGGVIIYEGFSLVESVFRIFLLWALTITFWSTMLFVPMAVYSKYKEDLQPPPKHIPLISVLIPAYNEEKVIANTIEALIETSYPKKEIILIDDGSKDKTLEISKKYQNKITVVHKENGGKASALNYGLVYAKGEVVVIVDADTIIGKNALMEIIKGFEVNENVAAVAGNIKVRNRINLITICQALEYITGIQVVRRAFDIFGTITIVPGALGAFKKSALKKLGSYHKDTIVEDFDATVQLLKTGLITQGSTKSTAYTEAPSTLKDFVNQRKRWYRGNIQVLKRHKDALSNPRFGFLQRLAFPYLLLGMVVTPIVGFAATINAIIGILQGDGLYVAQVFAVFLVVHYLMTALALRIDEEESKLLWYAGFLVIGFKQIIDFLLLKAVLEDIFKRKAVWTSARRVGI